jgi:hypothetical protein
MTTSRLSGWRVAGAVTRRRKAVAKEYRTRTSQYCARNQAVAEAPKVAGFGAYRTHATAFFRFTQSRHDHSAAEAEA